MKHTKGPWRVGENGATIFGPKSEAIGLRIIATLVILNETKANAQLIAAAPEMLDVLFVTMHEILDSKRLNREIDGARLKALISPILDKLNKEK